MGELCKRYTSAVPQQNPVFDGSKEIAVRKFTHSAGVGDEPAKH